MRKVAWIVVVVTLTAAAIGGTLVASRRGGDAVVNATLAFTIVAALASLLAVAVTAFGNRANARHQGKLAEQQHLMAGDIRRLAELTESSLEEARAQRPDPLVLFLASQRDDHEERVPTEQAVLQRTRLLREIDVEAIVARERERALSTIPTPKPTPLQKTVGGAAYAEIERMAETMRKASMLGRIGPITDEERQTFADRVDRYAHELREWLSEYENWRAETTLIFVTHLRFENRGRVPAHDARVQLRFPDTFESVDEYPELDDPPDRPRFTRGGLSALTGLLNSTLTIPPGYSPRLLDPSFRSNVSPPNYRRGSLLVELTVDKLLHGVAEDTNEPVMLRVDADGEYEVPWEIHAENLGEPSTGTLRLSIETQVLEGPPIETLDDLLSKAPIADDTATD
jgi:hypothetical protein